MISQLKPPNVKVLSLTTVASPHRGSAFADYVFDRIGREESPFHRSQTLLMSLSSASPRVLLGLACPADRDRRVQPAYSTIYDRGVQSEDTRSRRCEVRATSLTNARDVYFAVFLPSCLLFSNPRILPILRDCYSLKNHSYFSYGATASPAPWSAFRHSHRVVNAAEGPNDGLVSVASSRWGKYQGTLVDVSHLDLINWTNRMRWLVWQMMGNPRKSVPLVE